MLAGTEPEIPADGENALPEGPADPPPAEDAGDRPAEPSPPAPATGIVNSLGDLSERIRRLEDVLASLQAPDFTRPMTFEETVHAPAAASTPAPQNAAQAPAASTVPPGLEASPLLRLLPEGNWLLFEVYAELRCIVRMLVDPRYTMTWSTRVLPLIILAAMVLSWITIAQLPVIGTLLDRVIFLLLGYLLFKVLGREALRYRQTSPDLPPSLRL